MKSGLVILSTVPGAGKTTFLLALAGALMQLGQQVQVLKPVRFTEPDEIELMQAQQPVPEQVFFDKMTRQTAPTGLVEATTPYHVTKLLWSRAIDSVKACVYPALLESHGATASPLRIDESGVMDGVDLAGELGLPVLMVTPKSRLLLSQLSPALAYIQSRGVGVAGWVGVGTRPSAVPEWDNEALYVSQQYRVPYFGELPYSANINLARGQLGDAVVLLSEGVDLLPIQQILSLGV